MSTLMVQTGYWLDYSYSGALRGQWTMTVNHGSYLLAAIATFMTFVGLAAWSILAFIIHQYRARQDREDVLHNQVQALYRNSQNPLRTSWTVLSLALGQMDRHEIREGKSYIPRTRRVRKVLWTVIAPLLTWLIFGLFGILSSNVANKAYKSHVVELVPRSCGMYQWQSAVSQQNEFRKALVHIGRTGLVYAQTCYAATNDQACGLFSQSRLTYTSANLTDCLFSDRCIVPPMQMTSAWINSHADLGINTASEHRMEIRIRSTCAVINVTDLTTRGTHYAGGPWFHAWNLDTSPFLPTFETYDRDPSDDVGYIVQTTFAEVGVDSNWHPVEFLNSTNGDVTIIAIDVGTALYSEPVYDPIFKATTPDARGSINNTYYTSDQNTSVVACVDQAQIRSADGSRSSVLGSVNQVLAQLPELPLTTAQNAIAYRLLDGASLAKIPFSVGTVGADALQASNVVVEDLSTGLPPDQWQIEMQGWFNTSLSMLQNQLVAFASKDPANLWPGIPINMIGPGNSSNFTEELSQMCHQQLIRNVAGYQSFSVLGICIIVVVGILLIVLNMTIPSIVKFLRKRSPRQSDCSRFKTATWERDAILRLHHAAIYRGTVSGPEEPQEDKEQEMEHAPMIKCDFDESSFAESVSQVVDLEAMSDQHERQPADESRGDIRYTAMSNQ